MDNLEKRLYLMSRDSLVTLILRLAEIDGCREVIDEYLQDVSKN